VAGPAPDGRRTRALLGTHSWITPGVEHGLYELPQDVVERCLRFLNAVDRRRPNDEQMADGARFHHGAARVPREADRRQTAPMRFREADDDVRRAPTRRQADGDVAAPRARADLPPKA